MSFTPFHDDMMILAHAGRRDFPILMLFSGNYLKKFFIDDLESEVKIFLSVKIRFK